MSISDRCDGSRVRCVGERSSIVKGAYRAAHQRDGVAHDLGYEPLSDGDEEVDIDARKRAWAQLLAKVYEVDPMVCPKCGANDEVQFRTRETAGSSTP